MVLHLYADESGNKSVDEHDGPFVGAIVGARSPITIGANLRGNPGRLVNYLQQAKATPWLCQVIPFAGYGEIVRTKFAKMNTMARAHRLVTGRHEYLPRDGFSPANMIWAHCVSQTLIPRLVSEVFTAPLAGLEVVFDRLTLADGERELVREKCLELPLKLHELLLRAQPLNPGKLKLALANLQLTRETVSVRWSDEPGVSAAEDGLTLAHWLGRHHLRYLRKPKSTPLHHLLALAGWKDYITDVTPVVTMPLDREAVDQWKRRTGLPEPQV